MFEKLFAESGLSLDRLKTLLEVGVAGSIVKAADGDPVRQSQYSRQIKELENFFRIRLVERQGKGMRLTPGGRELARISRFFMMGLSNFQRGCLAEEQVFRIGASATVMRRFLLPVLAQSKKAGASCVTEVVSDGEIERRLHDLTLDFGVVNSGTLSRPLQTKALGKWGLELWVPRALGFTEATARREFAAQRLPLVLAGKELENVAAGAYGKYQARLVCDNFVEAKSVMEGQKLAALLPDFLAPEKGERDFLQVRLPKVDGRAFNFYFAWNPRLLRLNPPASKWRDWLAGMLVEQVKAAPPNF